jgi:hypothetical protein
MKLLYTLKEFMKARCTQKGFMKIWCSVYYSTLVSQCTKIRSEEKTKIEQRKGWILLVLLVWHCFKVSLITNDWDVWAIFYLLKSFVIKIGLLICFTKQSNLNYSTELLLFFVDSRLRLSHALCILGHNT